MNSLVFVVFKSGVRFRIDAIDYDTEGVTLADRLPFRPPPQPGVAPRQDDPADIACPDLAAE